MTDGLLALAILVSAALLGWRAADDCTAPKLVLVQAEWSCRRSHPVLDVLQRQEPDGATSRVIVPVLLCDDWSRR